MKLSLLEDNCVADDKRGYPVYLTSEVEFESFGEVVEILQKHHIAIGSFKDNYRKGADWVSSDFLAVDFDDGIKSEVIHQQLTTLAINHLIIASKNHRKDKGDGKGIVERFHVFIPFSQ